MYLVKCKEKKRRKKNRISSNTNTDTKTQRELLNLLGQCIVWRNRENQQGVELIRCLQRRHFSSLFIYVGHHACSRSIDCNREHTQLSQSVGETKYRWNHVALTLESVQNVLQCDHKGRFCSLYECFLKFSGLTVLVMCMSWRNNYKFPVVAVVFDALFLKFLHLYFTWFEDTLALRAWFHKTNFLFVTGRHWNFMSPVLLDSFSPDIVLIFFYSAKTKISSRN